MLCRDPYVSSKGQAFPCGRCLPCRLKRKRLWTHRIMLESLCHGDSSFVTLTYSDEHLPMICDGIATLVPVHLTNFLKRLRFAIKPHKVRFYAVGEYGDESFRPHYHLALFGFPTCAYGRSRYDRFHVDCCKQCDLLRDLWGLGFVDLGELNTKSAQYVAGYVTKKMTRTDDTRLKGRWPEFARMSLRPGLGALFVPEIASEVLKLNLVEREGDVPSALRHGKRLMPLGRYLRRLLRAQVGMAPEAPAITLVKASEALQHLREVAFSNAKLPGEVRRSYFKELIQNESLGSIQAAESRALLHRKRGGI